MSATGKWNAKVDSPMGTSEFELDLVENDGVVTGTATAGDDTVELVGGVAKGNDLSWAMTVNKPMKMTLSMTIVVTGDTFEGTAKPKIFPASKVTGTRLS